MSRLFACSFLRDRIHDNNKEGLCDVLTRYIPDPSFMLAWMSHWVKNSPNSLNWSSQSEEKKSLNRSQIDPRLLISVAWHVLDNGGNISMNIYFPLAAVSQANRRSRRGHRFHIILMALAHRPLPAAWSVCTIDTVLPARANLDLMGVWCGPWPWGEGEDCQSPATITAYRVLERSGVGLYV